MTEVIPVPRPTIHTINNRSFVGFDVIKSMFDLSPSDFRRVILDDHRALVDAFQEADVDYEKLRSALVPQTDRCEAAFLFNSDAIDQAWYGGVVAEHMLSCFQRRASHSVLEGDILIPPDATRSLIVAPNALVSGNTADWGRQYTYCVYVNNLSQQQNTELHQRMREQCKGYLGFVPTTNRSRFRSVLAPMLPTAYVKCGDLMLVNGGGDPPVVGKNKLLDYPFEEYGYKVASVIDYYFDAFIHYKIQSHMALAYQEDVLVSLNALSPTPILLDLDEFEVLIDEAKFRYLCDKKGALLRLAGVGHHSRLELAAMVRAELRNDYIYSLKYNIDETVQFSIMLEFPREGTHPVKLSAGLKYSPEEHVLRIVTIT